MTKFRAPAKLYHYNVIQDKIHTHHYRESYGDDTYYYCHEGVGVDRIVTKSSIIFSDDEMPYHYNWVLFSSKKMCEKFRQKVVECEIEIMSNQVRDIMNSINVFSERLTTKCEVI